MGHHHARGYDVNVFEEGSLVSTSEEGGLSSTGHLSKVSTLLTPVKSKGFFKTLFFLTCVPDSMAFMAVTNGDDSCLI